MKETVNELLEELSGTIEETFDLWLDDLELVLEERATNREQWDEAYAKHNELKSKCERIIEDTKTQ